MSDTVTWFKVPIVGMPGWPTCPMPVTEDGRLVDADGEPLPIEERTRECGQDSVWMAGEFPICREHFPFLAEGLGDTAEAIEAAWREAVT